MCIKMIYSESISHSVMSDFLWSHGLRLTRLLCPWNSPGNNVGVGSHSLLQGILATQRSNLGLPHCKQILYHLSHQGSPWCITLPHLFKNVFQYQMAKFNSEKPQLLLHQLDNMHWISTCWLVRKWIFIHMLSLTQYSPPETGKQGQVKGLRVQSGQPRGHCPATSRSQMANSVPWA